MLLIFGVAYRLDIRLVQIVAFLVILESSYTNGQSNGHSDGYGNTNVNPDSENTYKAQDENLEKLRSLVRTRTTPIVDLVFAIPTLFESQNELASARLLATKLLTLFARLNPVGASKTHFGLIKYDDSERPLVTIKLSVGVSATNINKAKAPNFEVKPGQVLDLYRPLNLVYKHTLSESRTDSTKVIVFFVSSLSTGNYKNIAKDLNNLGSIEVFLIAIKGEDGYRVDMNHVKDFTTQPRVLVYDSYRTVLNDVNHLLRTGLPKTR